MTDLALASMASLSGPLKPRGYKYRYTRSGEWPRVVIQARNQAGFPSAERQQRSKNLLYDRGEVYFSDPSDNLVTE